MTGTYAMGAPWLHPAACCGRVDGGELRDWLAAMTGRRTTRTQAGSGSWGMFAGPSFGPPWVPGGRSWRAPKARRGDIRASILAVLAEQPMNGYQIIQQVAERSGGAWRPSPGSIYPTLQQLEDEGLIRAEEEGGRRSYTLTDEGRRYVAEHPDEVSAPWEAMTEAVSDDDGIRPLIGQVAAAMWQIVSVGTGEQQSRARDALTELRRRLYGILAEDEAGESR